MAGRDSAKYSRNAKARRCGVVMGGAVGAFVAAAAMATGSAAPARADFEDLLDPIIQPLLTSLTDSLAAFDPSAAVDLTSWTDSLLSSLNSIDLALPSTADAASAVAAAAEPAASTGGTIPLTVLEGTEPSVNASIDGGSSVPLLVDTGSSGLVIPYTDLDTSNNFDALLDLFKLGFPSGIGESGYSGGVDYVYLTYDNVSTVYGSGADSLSTTGPVDVEIFSYPTSADSPANFADFLQGNDVSGILGIGDNTAGPTTSPFADYDGVAVNFNSTDGDLVVGSNPDPLVESTSGAPISTDYISIDSGPLQEVSVDVDSGGVTGAIPESLLTSSDYNSTTDLVNPGTTIAVYGNATGTDELYHYTVIAANDPYVVSGSTMDSGIEPFNLGTIYLDYSPSGTGTTDYDFSS